MLLITGAAEREQRQHEDGTQERRRGLRIRQNRPVKIFEPTFARYFPGQTEDISSSGLRLELPLSTPVRAGKIVNVYVGASAAGETLGHRGQMVAAKVIWVDREAHPTRMVAGVEFLTAAAVQADAA